MEKSSLGLEKCPTHPESKVTGACNHCRRKICQECSEVFGPFCSDPCRVAGTEANIPEESEIDQERFKSFQLQNRIFRIFKYAMVISFVGVCGYFIWYFFFNPVGKILWEVPIQAENGQFQVLGIEGQNLILAPRKKGYSLVSLPDGKISKEISIKDPSDQETHFSEFLSEDISRVQPLKSGTLVIRDNTFLRFSSSWKLQYQTPLPQGVSHIVLSHNDRYLFSTSQEAKGEAGTEVLSKLTAFDLSDGKKKWRKVLKTGSHASHLSVMNGLVSVVITKYDKDYNESFFLSALEIESGKIRWNQKLESLPEWGPVGRGDCIYFMTNNQIYSMTSEGEPQWTDGNGQEVTIPFSEEMAPDLFIKESILVANLEEETRCYQLSTGKGLWKTRVQVYEEGFKLWQEKVFMIGHVAKAGKTVSLVNMPGFNQAKDVMEDLGMQSVTLDAGTSMLLCVHKKTGEILWQVQPAPGEIMIGNGKLIRIQNSSDSMFGQMRSEPETHLFQYDINSGKKVFSKSYKGVDLINPLVQGDLLIASTVDTESPIRKKDPQSGKEFKSGTNLHGRAVAFRLK